MAEIAGPRFPHDQHLESLHTNKPPSSTTPFSHTYNYPIRPPHLHKLEATDATMETPNGHIYSSEESIPHTPEKDLPGGGNWVVQKYATLLEERRVT